MPLVRTQSAASSVLAKLAGRTMAMRDHPPHQAIAITSMSVSPRTSATKMPLALTLKVATSATAFPDTAVMVAHARTSMSVLRKSTIAILMPLAAIPTVITLVLVMMAGKETVSAAPISSSVTWRAPVPPTPTAPSCPATMTAIAQLVTRVKTPSMLTVLILTSAPRVTNATKTPAAAILSAHTLAHVTLVTMATDVFALMMTSAKWVLIVALVVLFNVRTYPALTSATAQMATSRTQISCPAILYKSLALISTSVSLALTDVIAIMALVTTPRVASSVNAPRVTIINNNHACLSISVPVSTTA